MAALDPAALGLRPARRCPPLPGDGPQTAAGTLAGPAARHPDREARFVRRWIVIGIGMAALCPVACATDGGSESEARRETREEIDEAGEEVSDGLQKAREKLDEIFR